MGIQIEYPKWINKEFLGKVLAKPDSEIVIDEFKISNATKKGDNYSSDMYRALIDYQENGESKKTSVILKVMPSDARNAIMISSNTYGKEIGVYTDIISKMEALLRRIGDDTVFSPKCLYIATDPLFVLCFEDLTKMEYQMIGKNYQLNLEHLLPVVKKLAKFHACSAVLYEEKKSSMDKYRLKPILDAPERHAINNHIKTSFTSLAKEVTTWDRYDEVWTRFDAMAENSIQIGEAAYDVDESVFNVLNHGDLWTTNFMFKYNGDEVVDVMMLDYQLSYWGSPGIDLNFLIYGSLIQGARNTLFKFVIREYHTVLSQTLAKLEYKKKIPTLVDINIELLRKGFFGVLASTCVTPLIMMDPEDSADLNLLTETSPEADAFRQKLVANPRYRPFMQRLLKDFCGIGFLD